jgi:hypothetical protein
MLFACALLSAQPLIIDDAIQGTGLNQHNYVGAGWIHGTTTPTFHNSTLSASKVTGSYVTVSFEGQKFDWYTEKKNTHGIAAISIDGGPETFIDLYSSTEEHLVVYTSPQLAYGTHLFKIRVTGTKNPSSTNYYAIHDYISIASYNNTNTAMGFGAFVEDGFIPSQGYNSAFGYNALNYNTLSWGNTAIGANALPIAGKTINANTAVGAFALSGGLYGPGYGSNTAIGYRAMDAENPGAGNTALGADSGPIAGTTIHHSVAIGSSAKTTASNQVRIGDAYVTNIGGQVSWSTLSDGRFKKDLREDVSGLDFINALRPVSYTVDKTSVQRFLGVPDSIGQSRFAAKEQTIRQTGFVAQEVEKLVKKSGYVFNGVDAPQNDRDTYTIRYAEFVVPLVKAVQEMSAKLDEQQQQITELLAQIAEKEIDGSKSKTELMLFQNNPNPFSVDTEIKMTLSETTASARVIIYNLEGKELKDISVMERGSASVKILANELNAGMYIYALIADGKVVDTKRMILTK